MKTWEIALAGDEADTTWALYNHIIDQRGRRHQFSFAAFRVRWRQLLAETLVALVQPHTVGIASLMPDVGRQLNPVEALTTNHVSYHIASALRDDTTREHLTRWGNEPDDIPDLLFWPCDSEQSLRDWDWRVRDRLAELGIARLFEHGLEGSATLPLEVSVAIVQHAHVFINTTQSRSEILKRVEPVARRYGLSVPTNPSAIPMPDALFSRVRD